MDRCHPPDPLTVAATKIEPTFHQPKQHNGFLSSKPPDSTFGNTPIHLPKDTLILQIIKRLYMDYLFIVALFVLPKVRSNPKSINRKLIEHI